MLIASVIHDYLKNDMILLILFPFIPSFSFANVFTLFDISVIQRSFFSDKAMGFNDRGGGGFRGGGGRGFGDRGRGGGDRGRGGGGRGFDRGGRGKFKA